MIKKFSLLYNTVKHLKPTQVFYQFKYRLRKSVTLQKYYTENVLVNDVCKLSFEMMPPVYKSYYGDGVFEFLNLRVDFASDIDWAYERHGKLWNYNLQYANWLLQEDMTIADKLSYLISMYACLDDGRLALEPYPVSLRVINIIRLFSAQNVDNKQVLEKTYAELNYLSGRPEYHLLGNHLLENAFALMMGGAFFDNKKWIDQGQKILLKELEEQILNDGAHFELSPMYHQIIFFRLLELIDWYSKWEKREESFEDFLRLRASDMLAWLNNITFKDGTIPHFNDSAEGISYSTAWLNDYAYSLMIVSANKQLRDSGYRSIEMGEYECKIDCAQVGAKYQAGHGHADALSFVMHHKGKPLFVEKGTSTYQNDKRRYAERATSAHNTVVLDDRNQSEVWSAFRVGKRANVIIKQDNISNISAFHDGYKSIGINHHRDYEFDENEIVIIDSLIGNNKAKKDMHLHIAPGVDVEIKDNTVYVGSYITVFIFGASAMRIEEYEMADGYNRYLKAKKIIASFEDTLRTEIKLN